MRKLYAKGMNLAAQLSPSRQPMAQFTPLELDGNLVEDLGCGYLQSYFLLKDGQLIKSGYLMDSVTGSRILRFNRSFPRVIPIWQKMKFLGPLLSLRAGDQTLTLTNKDIVLSGVQVPSAFFGYSRVHLLDSQGRMYAMGENYNGQLGTGNQAPHEYTTYQVPLPSGQRVKNIGCGFQHTLMVTVGGQVFGCGKADSHQVQPLTEQNQKNIKILPELLIPQLVFNQKKVALARAGFKFSLLLTQDGQIYTFGDNRFGQCAVNYHQFLSISKPTKILLPFEYDERILDVKCGACHTLILTDRKVYFFGSLEQNQNPFSRFSENICVPTPINLPEKPIKIFANFDRSAIITQDGKAYVFGGKKYPGGDTGKLEIIEGFNFNSSSLIGLGFAHTIILP